MVFETYTRPDDIIFQGLDTPLRHTTEAGRKYGAYYIDAYMLKLIKIGLNCSKMKIPSTPQDGEDIKLALDLVSKAFDELTET